METRFKIVVKKDTEMLQDYILFTYRAKQPLGTFKLLVFSLGLLIIGCLGVREKPVGGIILIVIGSICLLFSLFKHKLALAQLKQSDLAYANQWELEYLFTNSGMYVNKEGKLEQNVGAYSKVSALFEDERNFFLGINNEDIFVIPKKCFVQGEPDQFEQFIFEKSQEPCVFVPFTIKNKWKMHRARPRQNN